MEGEEYTQGAIKSEKRGKEEIGGGRTAAITLPAFFLVSLTLSQLKSLLNVKGRERGYDGNDGERHNGARSCPAREGGGRFHFSRQSSINGDGAHFC